MTSETTVALMLRVSRREIGDNDEIIVHTPKRDDIDLDRLSPRARALAEAVADRPHQDCGTIWMEQDRAVRETLPDWETWYGPDGGDMHLRRPWSGWDARRFHALSDMDPHEWLEIQARKIPAGWHVLGSLPGRPVATQAYGMTSEQVVAYLERLGRFIAPKTWSGYVARGEAPAPYDHVGRTPLWDPDAIIAWANPTE